MLFEIGSPPDKKVTSGVSISSDDVNDSVTISSSSTTSDELLFEVKPNPLNSGFLTTITSSMTNLVRTGKNFKLIKSIHELNGSCPLRMVRSEIT